MTDDGLLADAGGGDALPGASSSRLLPMLLAMAMFVLVVDTTIMNVSISAVTESLGTTVSSVQSAIALEALVSAAFILINSKVGDLIGRKRAYVIGLLAYAVGALAMTLAQDVVAIIVFWAIIGGLGASLLLPAMQSLIHGNFEGAQRAKVYALVGAATAIAAAIGPLIGGVITTYWSWRVNFALEVVIIAIVLSGVRLVKDVPYTGDRSCRLGRRGPLGAGHGRRSPRDPGMAGGRRGRPRAHRGRCRRALLPYALVGSAQAREQGRPARPGPVRLAVLPVRRLAADASADRAGRVDDRDPDLPADRSGVQRSRGGTGDRAAVAEHVLRGAPRRQAGRASSARSAGRGRDSRLRSSGCCS